MIRHNEGMHGDLPAATLLLSSHPEWLDMQGTPPSICEDDCCWPLPTPPQNPPPGDVKKKCSPAVVCSIRKGTCLRMWSHAASLPGVERVAKAVRARAVALLSAAR